MHSITFKYFYSGLILVILTCSCSSVRSHGEPALRDGVIDLPVESAPLEVWEAARLWKISSKTVPLLVQTRQNGSRFARYYLNIGFEPKNYQEVRKKYHQILEKNGWQYKKILSKPGVKTYVLENRKLSTGFDGGNHPTTLLFDYEVIK